MDTSSRTNVEWMSMDLSNPKQFFILSDGVSQSGYETAFTVFKRYRCDAGCDICYIKDRWVESDGSDYFSEIKQDSIDPEQEQRILHAFEHFNTVSSIDDLFMLKHKFTRMFEFYKKHSHRMCLSSMTDMALVQQTPIILEELDFAAVYDITLSDTFLQHPSAYKAVMHRLTQLSTRYPIVKLRFIFSTNPLVNKTNALSVIKWAKEQGIHTSGNNNNREDWFFMNAVLKEVDHVEASPVMDGLTMHQVFTEATLMLQDRWVLTFNQSTQRAEASFYNIATHPMNAGDWLEQHLRSKLKQYVGSASIPATPANTQYVNYFSYATNHVVVNDRWNFIPAFYIHNRCSNMRAKLKESGFVENAAGFIKRQAIIDKQPIVPIYSFK